MLKTLISRISAPETPSPWSTLTAIGAMIATFASVIIGSTLALTLFPDNLASILIGWIIASILTIVFIGLTRRRTTADIEALRLDKSLAPLPIVLLLSLGLAVGLDILGLGVTGQFRPVPELLPICQLFPDGTTACIPSADIFVWIVAFGLMALAQPIAEELVFRGVVYPAFRKAAGAGLGLLICALLYALFHFLVYPAFPDTASLWYGLAAPFLIGLYLTGIRAYSQSTRAAIIAHVGFGLFAALKAFTLSG